MTTHCGHCLKIERVVALLETTPRGAGFCARGVLDCGSIAHFVTTENQIKEFRHTKRLISEVRIEE